jgi:hypothetical protein
VKQTHFAKPSHLAAPRTQSDGCWFAGADPIERHAPERSTWKGGMGWVLVILVALALALLYPR